MTEPVYRRVKGRPLNLCRSYKRLKCKRILSQLGVGLKIIKHFSTKKLRELLDKYLNSSLSI